MNFRVGLIGGVERATLRQLDKPDTSWSSSARPGMRRVLFDIAVGWLQCPVYSRDELRLGQQLTGPAIIEESGSSIALHPGDLMTVDNYGNLLVELCP